MTPSLQNKLNEISHRHNLTGISVAVHHAQECWWANTGEFDTKHDQALVYSLSKTFTATAILHLVKNKRLELDAPASNWLPNIPIIQLVTIRQLLNHTSGLPDYGQLEQYHQSVRQQPGCPWTDQEFLKFCLPDKLLFEPGSSWLYSNIGYLLLRLLLQKETGKSYKQALASLVLKPANLKHTRVIDCRKDIQSLVPGHSTILGTTGATVDVRTLYHPGWVAPGVLASTSSDICRFYHELFLENIVSFEELSSMCQLVSVPFKHPLFKAPGYGLGLMADSNSSPGSIFGHSGEGPGYNAACYHFIDKELTLAVICNSENPPKAEGILFQLLDVVSLEIKA